MKKWFLWLLVLASVKAIAIPLDYRDRTRFVEYNVPGTEAYLLVDTKTGCEYIRTSYGTGTAYTYVQGSCTVPEAKK